MSRYVIRSPQGLFYVGNKVSERKWMPDPADPSRNVRVSLLEPQFETMTPLMALKYETKADAETIFSNADLKDPKAFEGCAVFEAEFNSDDPHAVRAT